MKRKIKVVIYLNKKKRYGFKMFAGNNTQVGDSQPKGYKTKQSAMKTIKLLQGNNDWVIKDETNKK